MLQNKRTLAIIIALALVGISAGVGIWYYQGLGASEPTTQEEVVDDPATSTDSEVNAPVQKEGLKEIDGLSREAAIELLKEFQVKEDPDFDTTDVSYSVQYYEDSQTYRIHSYDFIENP